MMTFDLNDSVDATVTADSGAEGLTAFMFLR